MIKKELVRALEIISERLRVQNIKWVLLGSMSLVLQGVKVTPNDIDILTDKSGAYKINEVFKDCEVKPVKYSSTGFQRSYLGEFRINNVKVEVMGDYEEKVKGKWQGFDSRLTSPVMIQFKGMELPVSELSEQLKSYEQSGREKDSGKIEQIRKALEKQ